MFKTAQRRKRYDRQFKASAAKVVLSGEMTVKEHRGEIGPVKKACGPMEASRSGFYEHLGRKKPNARIERGALEGFVAEAFERHKGRCGNRRITANCEKAASP